MQLTSVFPLILPLEPDAFADAVATVVHVQQPVGGHFAGDLEQPYQCKRLTFRLHSVECRCYVHQTTQAMFGRYFQVGLSSAQCTCQ